MRRIAFFKKKSREIWVNENNKKAYNGNNINSVGGGGVRGESRVKCLRKLKYMDAQDCSKMVKIFGFWRLWQEQVQCCHRGSPLSLMNGNEREEIPTLWPTLLGYYLGRNGKRLWEEIKSRQRYFYCTEFLYRWGKKSVEIQWQ